MILLMICIGCTDHVSRATTLIIPAFLGRSDAILSYTLSPTVFLELFPTGSHPLYQFIRSPLHPLDSARAGTAGLVVCSR